MNAFNYRFDYNIGVDTSRQISDMLKVILGYYDGYIYIKSAYPVARHITLGKDNQT